MYKLANLIKVDNPQKRLFYYILVASFLTSTLTIIPQLFTFTLNEFLFSIGNFIICVICVCLILLNKYEIAYHCLLLGVAILIVIFVSQTVVTYYAMPLLFPVGIVYSFLFFEKQLVRNLYLLLFLVIQYYIVIFVFGHVYNQLADCIVLTAYCLVLFIFCLYFEFDLKEKNKQVKQTLLELDTSKRRIDIQETELEAKNNLMAKYIESNKQLENFAHLASHELKAPLRSITGFVQLLTQKSNDKFTKNEKEFLDIIGSSTKRMTKLITELQELSKVGETKIELAETTVMSIIEAIKFDRAQEINEKSVKIIYDNEINKIITHTSLVKQLFSNIIGNAIKYVEKDTQPHIKIESSENETHWMFHFHDNGIGIPKEFRGEVFNIFRRLQTYQKYEGSGIGLSICKKIVDMHQGNIWVEDSDLGGTCIVLTLKK